MGSRVRGWKSKKTMNDGEEMNINETIKSIRSCQEGCYKDRYIKSLPTLKNRIISVDELKRALPLVDDYRGQKILFISQAPSKQAWADGQLSTEKNAFLTEFLLPKVFKGMKISEALEIWKKRVFWLHTANCYPFVFLDGKNKNRDMPPDQKCANKYFELVVEGINPELIVLMGGSALIYFSASIKTQVDCKYKDPGIGEVVNWQYSSGMRLRIKTKNKEKTYEAIAVKHAVWDSLTVEQKKAYETFFQAIRDIK